MRDRPEPMSEAEYLLLLAEVAANRDAPVREVEAHLLVYMDELWNNPKIEDRTSFRALFPELDRPPTPREAIPVLTCWVMERLNRKRESEAPR